MNSDTAGELGALRILAEDAAGVQRGLGITTQQAFEDLTAGIGRGMRVFAKQYEIGMTVLWNMWLLDTQGGVL